MSHINMLARACAAGNSSVPSTGPVGGVADTARNRSGVEPAKLLVGDGDPRGHEFSIQMRAMYNDRSGDGLGLPVLIALASSLLERSTKGGLIVVGSLNLGGSIESLPNAIAIAEVGVEKQAMTLLMPVSARKQLNDLPDDLWTKINIEFYSDAPDAFFKAVLD